MAAFEAVARHLSFTRAAAELGLTKGTLSQHVSVLEEELGLKLLNRTSRKISLTQAGEDLLPDCIQMAEAAANIASKTSHDVADLVGSVSITTSHTLAILYLGDAIARFGALHPAIEVDLVIRERFVDLQEEGVDLALRVGTVQPPDLIAKKVGSFSMIVCAKPELASAFSPHPKPDALKQADWVLIKTTNPSPDIELNHAQGQRRKLSVQAKFWTNSGLCALSLVRAGAGIGLLPSFGVNPGLASGELVNMLPDWKEREGPVSLVWSPLAKRKRRVSALIDFLEADCRNWLRQ